jgi:GNAT superfamily N-acetyltransferase
MTSITIHILEENIQNLTVTPTYPEKKGPTTESTTVTVMEAFSELLSQTTLTTETSFNKIVSKQPNIDLDFRVDSTSKHQHISRSYFLQASMNNEPAAQASARYIDRSRISRSYSFYRAMAPFNDGESDGLNFAMDLFNDNGTLMDRHRIRGGAWGKECNSGAVLILGFLFVKWEFRNQGVARTIIEALLERARKVKGGERLMAVYPGVVWPDLESDEEWNGKTATEKEEIVSMAYEKAVRFYRAVGFRRIGRSKWFGLVLDERHTSRRIALKDDVE